MPIRLPIVPSHPLQARYGLVRLAGAGGQGQITRKLWKGKEFGAVRVGVTIEELG